MLGIVIDDSVFAVIIGVGFTSIVGLMAWIVRTLSSTVATVKSMDSRITNIETRGARDDEWERRGRPDKRWEQP